MKEKKGKEASVIQPLISDLVNRQKLDSKKTFDGAATISDGPLKQPDLYQDPGQGYNVDFVFPQD